MPLTFTPIATATLESASQYITFTSISNAYTDLFMVANMISGSSNLDYPTTWVGTGNSIDTGSNYSGNHFEAASGSVSAYSYDNATTTTLPYGQALDTNFYGGWRMWFFDYSATDKFKTMVADYYTPKSSQPGGVGTACWRNTGAINTIRIGGSGGFNMNTGSYATLWGVLRA